MKTHTISYLACLLGITSMLVACKSAATQNTLSFIPGTYVFENNNKNSSRKDTLVIRQDGTTSETSFTIMDTWREQFTDTAIKQRYDNYTYKSFYDEPTRSLGVNVGSGTVKMTFNPQAGTAQLGTITATKIR